MKIKSSPTRPPKVEPRLLLTERESKKLMIVFSNSVSSLRADGYDDVIINADGKELPDIRTNITLVEYFLTLSKQTGQSYDLRPICDLENAKDDKDSDAESENWEGYQRTDAPMDMKKRMAERVITIKPTGFLS